MTKLVNLMILGVLRHGKYEYSRGGNPTRECLEECVAKLENGKHCMAYSSGLGATMSIIEAFLEVRLDPFSTILKTLIRTEIMQSLAMICMVVPIVT